MTFNNRMRTGLKQLEALPEAQQKQMLNAFIRSQVKFLVTADIVIEDLKPAEATVSIANQAKVQNHIGTVHAAAMTLLAETATGMVLTMNIPDDKTQVAKSMQVKFVKMAQGSLKAVATLTEEQIQHIQSTEKGELNITVKVWDEVGNEPLIAEIIWAWFPAKKAEKKDDKIFLSEEVKNILPQLTSDTKAAWGNFKAQEMIEHLVDVLRMSYIKPWDKSREENEKQKQFKAFFYSDVPWPRNMQNPLFKEGVPPPLKNMDLDAAKADLQKAISDFISFFELNPEQTFFHYFAGEMSFKDLLRFHAKHFTHHFLQFELI